MNNILDNFVFPIEAQEDFINKGLVSKTLQAGINEYNMAGHDQGVSFRFFVAPVKNELKSQDFDFDINDEEEMIEWFVSKKHIPVEKVRFLPQHLLKFSKQRDAEGKLVAIGGKYLDQYKAWKAGMSEPGLPLSRWDELTVGQVHSFASAGIFSVQQLASMPRDRIVGFFPKNMQEAFEKAIRWVAEKNATKDVKKYADQLAEMRQREAKQQREIEELKQKVDNMVQADAPKKRGRPKKLNPIEVFGDDDTVSVEG